MFLSIVTDDEAFDMSVPINLQNPSLLFASKAGVCLSKALFSGLSKAQ